VARGSPADGALLADLALGEDAWVSLVIRRGGLVAPGADTTLEAGDELLVLVDPHDGPDVSGLFSGAPEV